MDKMFKKQLFTNAFTMALEEDCWIYEDITTKAIFSNSNKISTAVFKAKSPCVIAGIETIIEFIDDLNSNLYDDNNFSYSNLYVEFEVNDGDELEAGKIFGKLTGQTNDILRLERIILNIMQRMTGIATKTRKYVNEIKPYNTILLDTRKTAPCLRVFDKLAVKIGGAENHRFGLHDQYMIKDNHITECNSNILLAINKVLKHNTDDKPIIIEISNMAELRIVMDSGIFIYLTRLLLDNMVKKTEFGYDVTLLKEAINYVDKRIATEASGNITLESINLVASVGVTHISCGSLTHSVTASDISLKLVQN